MTYAVMYLRPDGWWTAGAGFGSEEEAVTAAENQLPAGVKWKVTSSGTAASSSVAPNPETTEE